MNRGPQRGRCSDTNLRWNSAAATSFSSGSMPGWAKSVSIRRSTPSLFGFGFDFGLVFDCDLSFVSRSRIRKIAWRKLVGFVIVGGVGAILLLKARLIRYST